MKPQCVVNVHDKVRLAKKAYDLALENTESFEEQNIGAALAYLMGAIMHDSMVDARNGTADPHVGALLKLLIDNDADELRSYFREVA